jgi:hypothetical protein
MEAMGRASGVVGTRRGGEAATRYSRCEWSIKHCSRLQCHEGGMAALP